MVVIECRDCFEHSFSKCKQSFPGGLITYFRCEADKLQFLRSLDLTHNSQSSKKKKNIVLGLLFAGQQLIG